MDTRHALVCTLLLLCMARMSSAQLPAVTVLKDIRGDRGAFSWTDHTYDELDPVYYLAMTDVTSTTPIILRVNATTGTIEEYEHVHGPLASLLVQPDGTFFFRDDVDELTGKVFTSPTDAGTPKSWKDTSVARYFAAPTDDGTPVDKTRHLLVGHDGGVSTAEMDGTSAVICRSGEDCFGGPAHTFTPGLHNGRYFWCWVNPTSAATVDCHTRASDGTGLTTSSLLNFGEWVAYAFGHVVVKEASPANTYAAYRLDMSDGSLSLVARNVMTQSTEVVTPCYADGVVTLWFGHSMWDLDSNTVVAYGNGATTFSAGCLGRNAAGGIDHTDGSVWSWNHDTSTFEQFTLPGYASLRQCTPTHETVPTYLRGAGVLVCKYGAAAEDVVVVYYADDSAPNGVGMRALVDKSNADLGATEFVVDKAQVIGKRVLVIVDGVLLSVEDDHLEVDVSSAAVVGVSVWMTLLMAVVAAML